MIKLIVSDVDGTILKDYSSKISSEFCDIIHKFREKGVYFAAATGRQYISVLTVLKEIKDVTYFITENGSTIKFKDETLFKSVIPIESAYNVVNKIKDTKDLEIIVSTEDKTFLISNPNHSLEKVKEEVEEKLDLIPINSLNEVNTEISKISVFNRNGVNKEAVKHLLTEADDKIKGVISGRCWFDYVNLDINKGNSMKYLCDKLNISLENVIAFGDNFNDIEMLSMAKYSYAMDSAHEDVKKAAKNTCKSVEEVLHHFYTTFYK